MADADSGLTSWIHNHAHLVPAELEVGESGMALLLLWEVDHGCPWPSQADADDQSGILAGFTRRLKRRVAADPVLSLWLQCADVQRPLAFGLADTHHSRWSVQVRRPPAEEPQGWWLDFTDHWRTYLATQQHQLPTVPALPAATSSAAASAAVSSTSPSSPAPSMPLVDPQRKRQRARTVAKPRLQPRALQQSHVAAPAAIVAPVQVVTPDSALTAPSPPDPQRSRSPPHEAPARKRQATLSTWIRSPVPPPSNEASSSSTSQVGHRHGRATQGPPT